MRGKYFIFAYFLAGVLSAAFLFPNFSYASLIDDLQKQINDRNATISALEKEIAKYEAQVSLTSKQAATLKSLISTLDTTKKKLDAQIQVTQNKISATELTINKLSNEIADKKDDIERNSEALSETLRRMNQTDDSTILEAVLADAKISTFVDDVQNLMQIQGSIKEHVDDLQNLKKDLQDKQSASQKSKNDLLTYKGDLSSQQKAVVYDSQVKSKLLADTKSQEANYQKILAQKKALKDQVERELNDYEAQLKLAVDPKSIPGAKKGILDWPLSKVKITQYFGNTDFAAANSALYGGNGHRAIDLAASIGTPVKAALSGTIAGTGDTDTACPGGSYGRWVLIKHDNGLSTLYAHLSVIRVSKGQRVTTGETIGLSGSTGYATGPHLHFSLYASQGVEIATWPSASCKGSYYTTPVAVASAYLNPLSYLPGLP